MHRAYEAPSDDDDESEDEDMDVAPAPGDPLDDLVTSALRVQRAGMTFDAAVQRVLEDAERPPPKRVLTDDPVARAAAGVAPEPADAPSAMSRALGLGDDFVVEDPLVPNRRRRLRLCPKRTAARLTPPAVGTAAADVGASIFLNVGNMAEFRHLVPGGEDYVVCAPLRRLLDDRLTLHVIVPRTSPFETFVRRTLLGVCIEAGTLPDGWLPARAADDWFQVLAALVMWLEGTTAHARLLALLDDARAALYNDDAAKPIFIERQRCQRNLETRVCFLQTVTALTRQRAQDEDGRYQWSPEALAQFQLIQRLADRSRRLLGAWAAVQPRAMWVLDQLLDAHPALHSAIGAVKDGLLDPAYVRLLFGDWSLGEARAPPL